jgi:ribose transport system substrate-binding protein
MLTFRRSGAAALAVTLGLGAFMVGCGSGDDSEPASTGASSATGTAAAGDAGSDFMAKAEKAAADARAPITPTVPTSGPKGVKGKKIVLIPCSAAAQGCKALNDWFKKAAADLGWETLEIDPAGDPGKMADAVQKAIDIKADGIYTSAIDAATIAAPLRKAKAAGLKSVCASCTNEDDLYTMSLPAAPNYVKDGYNLAAQMYVDTGGKLRMIMLEDDEFGNTRLRQQGARQFVQECKDAGGDCEIVATQKVLITNISTSVPNQVASLARRHPEWNALFAPYDAILTFVIPALQQAGVAGEGKAYGFDPIDLNTKWIDEGNVETATVATPYRWQGYAAVDILNRAFQGEDVTDEGVKDKLLTKENLPPNGEAYLDDEDVSAAYRKLWGVG